MPWAPHLCWTEFLPGDNKICPSQFHPEGDFKVIFVCLQDLLGNRGMIVAATQESCPSSHRTILVKTHHGRCHPYSTPMTPGSQNPISAVEGVSCFCDQTSGRYHVLLGGQKVSLFTSISKSVCQPGRLGGMWVSLCTSIQLGIGSSWGWGATSKSASPPWQQQFSVLQAEGRY